MKHIQEHVYASIIIEQRFNERNKIEERYKNK